MKFTIDVDDFWLDEDELADGLTAHIKRDVVSQISINIKDSVEKQITKKIDAVIKDKIALIIDSKLNDLVSTGTIIINRREISIEENIKNVFQSNSGWSNANQQIERVAKKFGQELKLQYNNAFANQIVLNMKQQGFLKNDVVKVLLGDSNSEAPKP